MPDYPKLAQLWWQAIGDASSGAKTPQEAMDSLCAEQEKVMERIEKAGVQGDIGPKMAEEQDLAVWNAEAVAKRQSRSAAEDREREGEAETINYDELVKSWQK